MVESGTSPKLVLSLVMRLPDTSMTAALMSGGREHLGWGMDRYLAAATYDAINANTRATGNWEKGKAPKIPEWPRPKAPAAAKKTVTVADLHAQLIRR